MMLIISPATPFRHAAADAERVITMAYDIADMLPPMPLPPLPLTLFSPLFAIR
jgi:hypothetical protein